MFRYLSDAEYDTVRERASTFCGKTNCAGRMAAGIVMGLHGMRVGEVCSLLVKYLDCGKLSIHGTR
jgi:integrase